MLLFHGQAATESQSNAMRCRGRSESPRVPCEAECARRHRNATNEALRDRRRIVLSEETAEGRGEGGKLGQTEPQKQKGSG